MICFLVGNHHSKSFFLSSIKISVFSQGSSFFSFVFLFMALWSKCKGVILYVVLVWRLIFRLVMVLVMFKLTYFLSLVFIANSSNDFNVFNFKIWRYKYFRHCHFYQIYIYILLFFAINISVVSLFINSSFSISMTLRFFACEVEGIVLVRRIDPDYWDKIEQFAFSIPLNRF